jgi:nitrate/TMAO reductase-like tetraheme cytochrome c subunit
MKKKSPILLKALKELKSFEPVTLSVELVPKTSHFQNLRKFVSASSWKKLSTETAARAKNKCEICGGKGKRWAVECHEIWDYDDTNRIQKLKGLIALCPDCHGVKHIGLKFIQDFGEQATEHLADINGWEIDHTRSYLKAVKDVYRERSRYKWKLDLSWACKRGIEIQK